MPSTIKVNCHYCNNDFFQLTKYFNLNNKRGCKNYCSAICSSNGHNKKQKLECEQCKKVIFKKTKDIKKTSHNFCSRSCSSTFHNNHKTKGYRRSKLEIYLEKKLKMKYGENFIKFNDHTEINSELDIFIPSLKLAFELNGIVHYEPIYGVDKLNRVKNNDERKFQACIEKNISLCIIDTASIKYFKDAAGERFYDIIINIIDKNIAEGGVEPL